MRAAPSHLTPLSEHETDQDQARLPTPRTQEGGEGAPPSPPSLSFEEVLARQFGRTPAIAAVAVDGVKRIAKKVKKSKRNIGDVKTLKRGPVKELRDHLMLMESLAGKPASQLAEDYQVSPRTVTEVLSETARKQLYAGSRDYIGKQLLPKALKVLETALDAGNVDVAKDIVQGLAVLGPKAPAWGHDAALAPTDGVVETFEALRLRLVRERAPLSYDPTPTPTLPSGDPGRAADRLLLPTPAVIDVEARAEDDSAGSGSRDVGE